MLILRRKVGERVIIAHQIEVSILAVEGQRVKIGIHAPDGVTIVREELLRPPSPPQHRQDR
jgi:carbon storage regulator